MLAGNDYASNDLEASLGDQQLRAQQPPLSLGRGQPGPEACFPTVRQPQRALVGFVGGVAAIILDARAQRAKLKKVARAVSIRLGIAAGENGLDEGPQHQGGGQ